MKGLKKINEILENAGLGEVVRAYSTDAGICEYQYCLNNQCEFLGLGKSRAEMESRLILALESRAGIFLPRKREISNEEISKLKACFQYEEATK